MNNPVLVEVASRIARATNEQKAPSVTITPRTARILDKHMVGNVTTTLELLCRLADAVLTEYSNDFSDAERALLRKLVHGRRQH